MSDRAKEIIDQRNRELARDANFRGTWQETADLVFPRDSDITTKRAPGTRRNERVYDTTAEQDSEEMANGLSSILIPSGQPFFRLKARDVVLEESEVVSTYLGRASEILHDSMFASNFMLQLNETLRSLVVFGTGNLFSEWDNTEGGLNYKDFDIANYQILENNHGTVDTVILTLHMTARQAVQEFGKDKVSKDIAEAAKSSEASGEPFEFIHFVGPRADRNVKLSDSLNMSFESIFVDVKAGEESQVGGFEEMPFSVPRWKKSSNEKWGRGQGTKSLPDIKMLQVISRDFIECGNKWNNPPLQVHQDFDGLVKTTPSAVNKVGEMDIIKALDAGIRGNFPITKEMLEWQQTKIHKAFYRELFAQLAELTHRQTTVEVRARMREGLRRLATPVQRLERELLSPIIMRSTMLLIRNGIIPEPPVELSGQELGIEYMGPLALALRDQQAAGFIRWVSELGAMAEAAPQVLDYPAWDRAVPRLAKSYGVNTGDLATGEEVQAIRNARAQEAARQEALAAAESASKAYKQGSGAPEEGSPAGQIMEALS